MIIVANKRTHTPRVGDVYIGRGSELGNPFSHMPNTKAVHYVGSREQAISDYEIWIKQKIADKDPQVCATLNYIHTLAKVSTVHLVCYCSPLSCHGDVIKRLVESKL